MKSLEGLEEMIKEYDSQKDAYNRLHFPGELQPLSNQSY